MSSRNFQKDDFLHPSAAGIFRKVHFFASSRSERLPKVDFFVSDQ